MKKTKKAAKTAKRRSAPTRRISRTTTLIYGIERDFVIITGGGFLVIVLGVALFS